MARLADGTELAVKVQYPGVSDAVRADLANTNLLASVIKAGLALLGPQVPSLDPKVMVDEIRDRVVDELDYRIEAANQQEFHTLYDGHPFIHIPAVHPEFSTGRVLATDYVRGMRWLAATAANDDNRSRWGEAIFRFVFSSLHHHGLFNADPHPGNYLFHEEGTVTFLDFGCVNRFTAGRVSAMSALVDAALACDAPGLLQAFINVGLLADKDAEGLDPCRLLEFYRSALRDRWDAQPFTYTPESGGRDRGWDMSAVGAVVRHHPAAFDAQGSSLPQSHHHRGQFHTRTSLRHRRLEVDRFGDPPRRTPDHRVGSSGSRLARPSGYRGGLGLDQRGQPGRRDCDQVLVDTRSFRERSVSSVGADTCVWTGAGLAA